MSSPEDMTMNASFFALNPSISPRRSRRGGVDLPSSAGSEPAALCRR